MRFLNKSWVFLSKKLRKCFIFWFFQLLLRQKLNRWLFSVWGFVVLKSAHFLSWTLQASGQESLRTSNLECYTQLPINRFRILKPDRYLQKKTRQQLSNKLRIIKIFSSYGRILTWIFRMLYAMIQKRIG